MYKLLNPTQIGTGYMVERLQQHIAQIGHEKVQSLKGENVRQSIFDEKFSMKFRIFSVIDFIRRNSVGITYEIHEYYQRYVCQ